MFFRIKKSGAFLAYHFFSIDGKIDKASSRNENELRDKIKALNVLNVYSNNYRMCIASEMIEDKTNEITTIPNIIKRFNANGGIITFDALNTQKNNIKAIIDAKADYVVALKGNQGNFYDDVVLYFDNKKLEILKARDNGYLKHQEKSHSTIMIYEYYQTEDIKWYSDYKSWEKLSSIGVVVKTIVKNNVTTVEKRYYVSSLFLDINLFSESIRSHWNVENKLHWYLDFTFKCDSNTTMNKKALLNLQLIKKFSLALLTNAKEKYDCSLTKLRFRISLNFEVEILRLFNILSH